MLNIKYLHAPADTVKRKYNAFADNCDIPTKLYQALIFVMLSIQFSLKQTKYWWYCVAHFHLFLTPPYSYYQPNK